MNKITEARQQPWAALKLAEEVLAVWSDATASEKGRIALAAIRDALAFERSDEALANHIPDATKMVAEHKCGGCAKTAADGWALYCVECWEKAEPVKQEPVCIDWDTKKDEPIMGYAAPVDAKAIRAEERKRTVEILMEMHRKANGEHNYYHYAANEIQGFNVSAEREWVNLTNDEIEDAVGYSINKAGIGACRAVIAAFKEKQRG